MIRYSAALLIALGTFANAASPLVLSADELTPGALQIYGDKRSLPVVVSPQLSDWYWLPSDLVACL